MSAASHLIATAKVLEERGDLQNAENLCRTALSAHPGSVDANLVLGRIAARTRRVPEAIEYLRRALELDSHCFDAMIWLVPILRTGGSHVEALELASRGVQVRPNDAAAYSLQGSCLLALNRPDEAAASFRKAVDLEPDQAVLHYQLAGALRGSGRLTEVIDCYRVALELDPASIRTIVSLAQAVGIMGDRKASALLYRRAYELEPDTGRGLLNLARACIDEENPSAAEAALRKVVMLDRKSYLGHLLLGAALRRQGRFEEAEAALKSAIQINPRDHHAYSDLVYCRRMAPTDQPIIRTLEALLGNNGLSDEDRSTLEYAVAKAMDDLADYEEAIIHFDEANRLALKVRSRRNPDRDVPLKDPALLTYSPEDLARLAANGHRCERPIFVVGMMRSGTTLMEQMLSCHTQIGGAGELDYWPRALENRVAEPVEVERLGRSYCDLLETICPDAPRVVDKMPGNYRQMGAIHAALPEARFVLMSRNSADTCLSIWTTPNRADVPFAHDRGRIVRAYREYLHLIECWRRLLPGDRLFEVRYEDLVREPGPVMRALLAFIGLPWEERCLHPESNTAHVETPSLWQVRQPLYSSSVERWRRYQPWLGEFASLQDDAAV